MLELFNEKSQLTVQHKQQTHIWKIWELIIIKMSLNNYLIRACETTGRHTYMETI